MKFSEIYSTQQGSIHEYGRTSQKQYALQLFQSWWHKKCHCGVEGNFKLDSFGWGFNVVFFNSLVVPLS